LKQDGTVVAWGAGVTNKTYTNGAVAFGQNLVPSGLTNVAAIAAGKLHSLALVAGGPPAAQVYLSTPALGTNGFSVSVPAQPGRVYRLEYKNSLADPGWTPLPLQAGQYPQIQLTDPQPASNARFYRVRQW
jgi:hypothetical protein